MLDRGNQVKARREAAIVNPSGLCECGCGQPAPKVDGKSRRFIFRHAAALRRRLRLESEAHGEKVCRACQTPKPLGEFSLTNRGGRHSYCKLCVAAESGKRFKRNPAAKLKAGREWYEANREARLKQTTTWQKANPEKIKIYTKRYRMDHSDQARASYHKYRARVAENGGEYSGPEWRALLSACGHRCVRCGIHQSQINVPVGWRKALEHDHIIPISLGGTSWIWNMQPLCPACNRWKHEKKIDFRSDAVRLQFRLGA